MAITTVTDVKKYGQLSTEYDDTDILAEIDIVEAEFYDRYHLPKRSKFSLDPLYDEFYFYPQAVHEIIRMQAQVDTNIDPSGYTSIGSSLYTFNHGDNFISVGSDLKNNYSTKMIRIQHIPLLFSKMVALQVAINLVDGTTIVDGTRIDTPLISRLKTQLNELKTALKSKTLIRSSEYAEYDPYEYISYQQADFR